MGNKEHFAEMRQQGFDMDMSGMMYQEPKQSLEVMVTHFGDFYKAELDGEPLTRQELFKLLGIDDLAGFRLELYLTNFEKNNNGYVVNVFEINVE